MMSPHFGHMCALIHRFSRLIEGSQIQQIVHSVQLLRNDHVLIRDSLKLPESTMVPSRRDELSFTMLGDLPDHSV
jgi:hypothetical protein